MNELDERVGYWQTAHASHPYAAPSFAGPRAQSSLSTTTSMSTTTTAVSSSSQQQHYSASLSAPQHSPPRNSQQPAGNQSPRPAGTPSSRRALTHALELAQVAVRLDAQNDDPGGAIYAYARSVSLLNHVMNSVMRGDDDNIRRRSGRRRSSVSARQDEINRLRAIVSPLQFPVALCSMPTRAARYVRRAHAHPQRDIQYSDHRAHPGRGLQSARTARVWRGRRIHRHSDARVLVQPVAARYPQCRRPARAAQRRGPAGRPVFRIAHDADAATTTIRPHSRASAYTTYLVAHVD